MNVEFKILDSGLTVLHDQMDVESTSVGVYIGSGSTQEKKHECGIAHMLEHMAFKGTENRNAEKIAREIEDVGGDINAYTSKEVTAYYLKVLKENTNLGIDILSDIIKNSTFPKDEIERERGVIISEIGQSYDAPDDRVFENFTSTAFKNQNDVNIFLGADGVHLLSIKNEGEVVGQGTGDLKNHLDFLKEKKIKLYVSGMSAKARGYDDSLLDGFNAEFSMPDKLLLLSTEADSTLCY